MSTWAKTLLRCKVVPSDTQRKFVTLNGSNPRAWKACGVRFGFSFFDLTGNLLDVTNIASLTVFAKTLNTPAGSPIILATITSFDATLNATRWAAGEDHCLVDFSATEMSAFSSAGSYDLTVAGLTTDEPADQDCFGMAVLEIADAGVSNVVAPAPEVEGAVTLSQVMGILNSYARKVGQPGDTLTLTSPDGATKRILGISNDAEPIDSVES